MSHKEDPAQVRANRIMNSAQTAYGIAQGMAEAWRAQCSLNGGHCAECDVIRAATKHVKRCGMCEAVLEADRLIEFIEGNGAPTPKRQPSTPGHLQNAVTRNERIIRNIEIYLENTSDDNVLIFSHIRTLLQQDGRGMEIE